MLWKNYWHRSLLPHLPTPASWLLHWPAAASPRLLATHHLPRPSCCLCPCQRHLREGLALWYSAFLFGHGFSSGMCPSTSFLPSTHASVSSWDLMAPRSLSWAQTFWSWISSYLRASSDSVWPEWWSWLPLGPSFCTLGWSSAFLLPLPSMQGRPARGCICNTSWMCFLFSLPTATYCLGSGTWMSPLLWDPRLPKLKTRMQSLSPDPKARYTSIYGALQKIMRTEGFWRPLRGVNVMVMGAGPAHAMYFACYENMKRTLNDVFHHQGNSHLANGILKAFVWS